jgi:flagellar hook-length control protein FliK
MRDAARNGDAAQGATSRSDRSQPMKRIDRKIDDRGAETTRADDGASRTDAATATTEARGDSAAGSQTSSDAVSADGAATVAALAEIQAAATAAEAAAAETMATVTAGGDAEATPVASTEASDAATGAAGPLAPVALAPMLVAAGSGSGQSEAASGDGSSAAARTTAAATPPKPVGEASAAGLAAEPLPGEDSTPAKDGAPGLNPRLPEPAAKTEATGQPATAEQGEGEAATGAANAGTATASQEPAEQNAVPTETKTAATEAEATEKLKALTQAQGAEQKANVELLPKLDQALQALSQAQRQGPEATDAAGRAPQANDTARPLPPSAVPVEIGLRALQGLKEFQIRLDPAELGRVDVRLEIGEDKSVSAKVVVDRVDTLHLLQRDAKTLERAFEQAGLKSSDAGIDITLRDPGQQQRNGRDGGWDGDGQFANRRPGREDGLSDIQPPPPRRMIHAGALDLSV